MIKIDLNIYLVVVVVVVIMMVDTVELESLQTQLEFERICNKIDRILYRKRLMKLYNTALQISRDFMKYVEDHPTNTNSDSDSECDDDDNYSVPFTMQEFCTEYDWESEKAQEIKDVFRL